jgi:hypothetical protein
VRRDPFWHRGEPVFGAQLIRDRNGVLQPPPEVVSVAGSAAADREYRICRLRLLWQRCL